MGSLINFQLSDIGKLYSSSTGMNVCIGSTYDIGCVVNGVFVTYGSGLSSLLSSTGANFPRSRNEATAGQLIQLRYNTSSNTSTSYNYELY